MLPKLENCTPTMSYPPQLCAQRSTWSTPDSTGTLRLVKMNREMNTTTSLAPLALLVKLHLELTP